MEEKLDKNCQCDESCDCGCNEGKECTCDSDCSCDCTCNDECTCGCECDCDCDCHEDDCDCNCDCDCHDEDDCECNQECQCETENETIKALEEKVKELENKALLSHAEMINYRRRKDEEVARMLKYANEDIVTELLQTIDSFERAIKMDDNNLEDEVSKFLEGFKLIYCNLVSTLEKYDVKAIDGSNKEFDPQYHQAVMTDHVDGVEPGMVLEVLQKGYLLKDKVIRPAMVKVSE